MIRAAQAVGVTPLVRPVDHTPGFIMKVLDAGALGVVVPDIVTADQARAVVSAARYGVAGNGGSRGACPSTRAAWHQTDDWPGFMRHANETVSVWLILESREAFANADEILAVPGIDAVIPGTFDLSHEMQLFGQREHEAVTQACLSLTQKAAARSIAAVRSIRSQGGAEMALERQEWQAHGARIFHVGGDRRLLRNAWRDRLRGLQD
jgi:4-hydroxy-2-oxoheptanedioate aldolase